MRNRKILLFYYIAILSCFFVIWCEEIIKIPPLTSFVSIIDELFIICIFTYSFFTQKVKQRKLLLLILIFFVTGSIGSYFSYGISKVTFLGAFNTIKPLLLYWSFANMIFYKNDVIYFFKLLNYLFIPILIFEIVDILIPHFRSYIGFIGHVSEVRMGFRSIAGIMPRFTMITIMGFLYFYIYGFYINSKWKQLTSSMFILLSLRVKDIFGFLFSLLCVYNRKIKTSNLFILLLTIFGLVFIYYELFPEHFMLYFSGEREDIARVALSTTSISIMMDYMPWGVGWGLFASPLSQQFYSPVYDRYHISYIYGLDYNNSTAYMADTFWPMIVGETGILGLIVYTCILIYIFKEYVKAYFVNPKNQWSCLVVSLLIFNLICSIAKPTFSGPPNSLLLFGLAGIFFNLKGRFHE